MCHSHQLLWSRDGWNPPPSLKQSSCLCLLPDKGLCHPTDIWCLMLVIPLVGTLAGGGLLLIPPQVSLLSSACPQVVYVFRNHVPRGADISTLALRLDSVTERSAIPLGPAVMVLGGPTLMLADGHSRHCGPHSRGIRPWAVRDHDLTGSSGSPAQPWHSTACLVQSAEKSLWWVSGTFLWGENLVLGTW